jgi:hypothetical protein
MPHACTRTTCGGHTYIQQTADAEEFVLGSLSEAGVTILAAEVAEC